MSATDAEKLMVIFDGVPAGVCVRAVDSLVILAWNNEAERISGCPRDALIGKTFEELGADQKKVMWLKNIAFGDDDNGAAGVFRGADASARTLRVRNTLFDCRGEHFRITAAADMSGAQHDPQKLIDFVQRVMFGDHGARLPRDDSNSYADVVAELFNVLATELGAQVGTLRMQLQTANKERDAAISALEIERSRHNNMDALQSASDLNAISTGILICDETGKVVMANTVLLQLLGQPAEAIMGQSLPLSFWRSGPSKLSELVGDFEAELLCADGSLVKAELNAVPLHDPRRAIVSVRDVRHEYAIRQKLYISERQATIGTLASGVAHEINNPLMYISGNLELAMEAVQRDEPTIDLIDMLQDAYYGADLIKKIVADLRLWTRAQADRLTNVELGALLQSCVAMAKPVLKHRALSQLDVEEGLRVPGYEARLAQLFLNLVVNAAQAVPEGNVTDNLVRVSAKQRDPFVVIEVNDTGCGMSEDQLGQVFEPFFTTKGTTGTGLGLALVKDIVDAHGGVINVESAVNVGTTIRVSLPIKGSTTIRPDTMRGEEVVGEELVILLIDDDAVVADTLRRSLDDHNVTTISDARKALTLLYDNPHQFDVVLCDVMMPLMSGIEFFTRLKKQDPVHADRIVFMTGGGMDQANMQLLESFGRPLLWKPIKLDALRDAVVSIVAGEQG